MNMLNGNTFGLSFITGAMKEEPAKEKTKDQCNTDHHIVPFFNVDFCFHFYLI